MKDTSQVMKVHADRQEACCPMLLNERGIALVVALIMLVLLGMLGALALSTSTTELHIAGNYKNSEIAYYNADVLYTWGPQNPVVNTAIIPYVVNSFPSGTGYYDAPMPTEALGESKIRVEFLCVGTPPAGSTDDAGAYLAYHYRVIMIGRGANNAEFVVETEISKLGPKPDGLEPDCAS